MAHKVRLHGLDFSFVLVAVDVCEWYFDWWQYTLMPSFFFFLSNWGPCFGDFDGPHVGRVGSKSLGLFGIVWEGWDLLFLKIVGRWPFYNEPHQTPINSKEPFIYCLIFFFFFCKEGLGVDPVKGPVGNALNSNPPAK